MEKFKKNKKIVLIGGILLILISGITFCIKSKLENKPQENSRELIAMFIQYENGEYSSSTSKEFPKEGYVLNLKKSTCKNGSILSQDSTTKKISIRTSHIDQCTLYFDKDVPKIELGDVTINIQEGEPNFARSAIADETAEGLFSMQDDYGTSYYYRGRVQNNYIKFGKNADGKDMWWRIIRFNGDGTIRMQYDGAGPTGTNTYTRGFALTREVWNGTSNDAKYVGWMFGGANESASTSREEAQRNETNSEIKTKVDEWYKKNIVDTGYGDYIADRIFCNDRSIPGKSETGWINDSGLGYGKNQTAYGATARTNVWNTDKNKVQPRFTCSQENDKFTVEVENGGNGALTYPVGLITADEIVAAGSGQYKTTNQNYYLYKGDWYLSFSPYFFHGRYAGVFYETGGGLGHDSVDGSGSAIAPVINLKAEYLDKLRGEGTIDNPYFLS